VRLFLYISSIFLSGLVFGQFTVLPIEQNNAGNMRKADTTYTDTLYTLQLPFWEDFSTSGTTPDSMKWAIGDNVYVNATIAKNPPTYKAATFDGLKRNGAAYDLSSEYNGPADSLISHYIDLSQVSQFNKNSVYLSFFWQAGGNGEMPDTNDSLRVQFYRADSTWVTQWVQIGGSENSFDRFRQVILPVSGDEYFHFQFRIKFEGFNSLRGPFDTWHIDYIYLNENRDASDTSYFDRGLTGSQSPLFGKFYQMPADHFFTNPMSHVGKQNVQAYNLDSKTAVGHPLEYYYQLKNLTTNELYDFADMGNGGLGGLKPREIRTVYGPDTSKFNIPINKLDSQVIEATFYYLTNDKHLFEEVNGSDTVFLPVDLKVNDTIKTKFTLQDTYAYDDGTAEFAVAINQLKGEVAIRYVIEEMDTLTAIDIYFPDIAPESEGASVDLLIWDELNDNHIMSRAAFTIPPTTGINKFSRVTLSKPLLVKDTIYVGYQQFTDNYIGVGFDRNNPAASSEIFTRISDNWEQNNRLSGAIMIRPVFGTDTSAVIVLKVDLPVVDYNPYPNPNRGVLYISETYQTIGIYNLSGQLQYASETKPYHDISFLNDGVYIMRINDGKTTYSGKLIVRKE